MKDIITEATCGQIRVAIQQELLRRGFHAPITVTFSTEKKPRFCITSELFQTAPVLFESIMIQEFGSYLSEESSDTGKEYLHIGIQVAVRYQHFGGGSNGCKLFYFTCDTVDGEIIFNIKHESSN